MNNIYKISQDINNDYETYDSAVVSAKTEDDARMIHPSESVTHISNGSWMGTYSAGGEYKTGGDDWVEYKDIGKIKVEYIGKTEKERGVILASYNPG